MSAIILIPKEGKCLNVIGDQQWIKRYGVYFFRLR